MGRHTGKVVIVTGGSAGIGRGVVEAFAADGASVVIHGLSREEVDQGVARIIADGGAAVGVAGEVSLEETHTALVEAAMSAFGRIDHLVTSAGIQTYGDAAETTPADFDRVFAVNVRGVFLAVHAAIAEIRRNAGTISLISSAQGVATQNNVVGYTSTKGALNAMARALAVDEAAYGVRVNAVLPGSVDTPMLRAAARDWSDGTDAGEEGSSPSGAGCTRSAVWAAPPSSEAPARSWPARRPASSPVRRSASTAACWRVPRPLSREALTRRLQKV
nr:SDR family oxidoreductase [Tessaracoccus coleopterorum]